ncbi:MAG: DEAD/DEAH box helicase [Rubrivivax sp.]|nr:DEAD/DEAH box helicase [Rubrivivax sp.]
MSEETEIAVPDAGSDTVPDTGAEPVAAPVAPALPAASFAELGLQPALARAAAAAGWARPSAIQAAALPAILQGRDVLAQAPTGAGKTGAFLLPLLQRLLATPGVPEEQPRVLRALVLAPTRELAAQTAAAAHALAPQLKTVLAVGGLSVNPQMMALRGGAHLLVATPGRLLDLTRQNAVRLGDLDLLVLDEADRLLDAGFADETRRVLALLPRRRQTLLFSATLGDEVRALAVRVQKNALCIQVDAGTAGPGDAVPGDAAARSAAAVATPPGAAPLPATLTQRAIVVDTARRTQLLRHLLKAEAWPRALVFVATQYAAEHVADKLRRAGVAAAALHGQQSSGRRSAALADLQAGRIAVLVATDLAARGLDLPGLPVVVNHDLPRSATDHMHRVGRTARAGAAGLAVSFVCADAPGSEAHFRLIEKRQQQRVPREQVAGFEPAAVLPALAADPNGGVKGRRKSKKDKLREAAALAGAAG